IDYRDSDSGAIPAILHADVGGSGWLGVVEHPLDAAVRGNVIDVWIVSQFLQPRSWCCVSGAAYYFQAALQFAAQLGDASMVFRLRLNLVVDNHVDLTFLRSRL